jgi:hypothetical protein
MGGLTYRERLERAIEAARPACRRCGNDHVTAEYRPALGDWVAVGRHWVWTGPEDACPVTHGGRAYFEYVNELQASLKAADPGLFGDYGETVWARRELAAA